MKGMNGHIITGTNICVDYWQWTPEKKYLHFLTHLHSDHTVGLKSTFREQIYTTPFNAWLLERWFRIDPDLLVPLTVGDTHVIYDKYSEKYFSVTLIDANHCPGSTMFLFQGPFGNILYTGDFRYNPDMVEHPMLKSLIENEAVHQLYLDNTFAAEHCNFPSREEAVENLISLISNHPDHFIVLGVRKLGKEEVFRRVALHFEEKILVSEERLNILKYMKYPNVFTTNKNNSRIFVKEMHEISRSFLHNLHLENGPVLTILLTALYTLDTGDGKFSTKMPYKMFNINHIPLSDHCSHTELQTFVSQVRPYKIFPIVLSKTTKYGVNYDEETSTDSQYHYNLKKLCDSSVIPSSILRFSRNWNKQDCKSAVTHPTQDKSRDGSSKNRVADQLQSNQIKSPSKREMLLKPTETENTNHSQEFESQVVESCIADTTTDALSNEEYCTMTDDDMEITTGPPELSNLTGDYMSANCEVVEMPDGQRSEITCNDSLPRPVSESNTIIEQQNLSRVESPLHATNKDGSCSNLNVIINGNILTPTTTHSVHNKDITSSTFFSSSEDSDQTRHNLPSTMPHALLNVDNNASSTQSNCQVSDPIKDNVMLTTTYALFNEDIHVSSPNSNYQMSDPNKDNITLTRTRALFDEDVHLSSPQSNFQVSDPIKDNIMLSTTYALLNKDFRSSTPLSHCQGSNKTIDSITPIKTNCLHIVNDFSSSQESNCDQSQVSLPPPSLGIKRKANFCTNISGIIIDDSEENQTSCEASNEKDYFKNLLSNLWEEKSPSPPIHANPRISEKFNHLLATRCQFNSDSFFDEPLPVSTHTRSSDKPTAVVKDNTALSHEPINESDKMTLNCLENDFNITGEESRKFGQFQDRLHPFYEKFPQIYKQWHELVQFECLKKHIESVKHIESNHLDMWQSYDWEAIFKLRGRDD